MGAYQRTLPSKVTIELLDTQVKQGPFSGSFLERKTTHDAETCLSLKPGRILIFLGSEAIYACIYIYIIPVTSQFLPSHFEAETAPH